MGKITLEGSKYDVEYSGEGLTVTNSILYGELEIKKLVTGNFGDKSKKFRIEVTFKLPEGKTLLEGEGIEVNDSDVSWNELTAAIYLKDGETVTFSNIPYGITYTVVESNYESYEVDYDIQDGDGVVKTIDSDKETVLITNNNEVVVDTGVSLDRIPYILVFGLAGISSIFWFMKRRKRFDFE